MKLRSWKGAGSQCANEAMALRITQTTISPSWARTKIQLPMSLAKSAPMRSVAVVDVGLDGDVDVAELVLEGEEADLLGRRWRLARDHEAGDSHLPAAWDLRKGFALEGAELVQPFAAEVDEVMAGREV